MELNHLTIDHCKLNLLIHEVKNEFTSIKRNLSLYMTRIRITQNQLRLLMNINLGSLII